MIPSNSKGSKPIGPSSSRSNDKKMSGKQHANSLKDIAGKDSRRSGSESGRNSK